jgi:hypothetical protein
MKKLLLIAVVITTTAAAGYYFLAPNSENVNSSGEISKSSNNFKTLCEKNNHRLKFVSKNNDTVSFIGYYRFYPKDARKQMPDGVYLAGIDMKEITTDCWNIAQFCDTTVNAISLKTIFYGKDEFGRDNFIDSNIVSVLNTTGTDSKQNGLVVLALQKFVNAEYFNKSEAGYHIRDYIDSKISSDMRAIMWQELGH